MLPSILYLIYASDSQHLLSPFRIFVYLLTVFTVTHQHTKTDSLYVKTYLGINVILKTNIFFMYKCK